MTLRLNAQLLPALNITNKPKYLRDAVHPGIVHLGIGAFHRAHQAVYTDALLATGDLRWGIIGASLRSGLVRDALAPQNHLYSVQTLGAQPDEYRIIGSVIDTLALTEAGHRERLLDHIAHPATQVITLTVTEKGYCSDASGELDANHPDVVHDLEHPQMPRSAPGLLAQGLAQRMRSNAGPISIVSCDNLAGNGAVAGQVVATMLQQQSPEATAWLQDNASFPASMVDRIVPQTTMAEIAEFATRAGYQDNALVQGEEFSQWVIADQFAGTRPGWDAGGAQFVEDVAPFEQAKLRLLNATHSALAYLGLLAGYEYVHEAIADPSLASFARDMMEQEITPVVAPPPGLDLTQYKADIMHRFANAKVPYRTAQVAADGSKKLVQRVFPTIQARLERGASVARLATVVAAWLHCLERGASGSLAAPIDDPAADQVVALGSTGSSSAEWVSAIAKQTAVFGDLAHQSAFLEAVAEALAAVRQ